MHKVYLSPSLQEHNVGVGKYGTEMDRMFEVALAARRRLMDRGVAVRMSSRSWAFLEEGMGMHRAVKDSNDWGADLHIAIHSNAGPKSADGTMTMYMPGSEKGRRIATLVQKHVAPISPGSDIGLATAPVFYETRAANAPVAYLELAYHTNYADALSVIEHHDRYGAAIAEACLEYFGMAATQPPVIKLPVPEKKPRWWGKMLRWLKLKKKRGA